MFSVTSGVYDGQSLAGEECDAMGRQVWLDYTFKLKKCLALHAKTTSDGLKH